MSVDQLKDRLKARVLMAIWEMNMVRWPRRTIMFDKRHCADRHHVDVI